MLKQIMLASAIGLMATPAFADPDKDESRRDREWHNDRQAADRYYSRRDRNAADGLYGHMPPPGLCRVWFPGLSAGQQPRPKNCYQAEREAQRHGGRVIYGRGSREQSWGDDNERQFRRWALRNFDYNRNGRLSSREYQAAMYAWNRR